VKGNRSSDQKRVRRLIRARSCSKLREETLEEEPTDDTGSLLSQFKLAVALIGSHRMNSSSNISDVFGGYCKLSVVFLNRP